MASLTGKVAIITGGGQGVGLGIAGAFAREGASLLLTGRDLAKLEGAADGLRKTGAGEVTVCVSDVRRRADADKTVRTAIERFGRLDILVNNAQSSAPGKLIEEIDDEIIDLTLQSGLLGTLYHMQAAFPHLKEKGGAILNLGSREGIVGGVGFSIYAAAKEGIRAVSRSAAREWGKYGIRVNVICPAALSPAAVTYLDAHPEHAEMYRKEIALGRFGDPQEDIGPVAVFLVSDEARYVTGQTVNVDGGQVML